MSPGSVDAAPGPPAARSVVIRQGLLFDRAHEIAKGDTPEVVQAPGVLHLRYPVRG